MKRAIVWLAVGAAGAVTLATVSWTPGVTLQLVDPSQAPVALGYVRYHYAGHLINPVHSVTYDHGPGASVRTSADGSVAIRPRLHLRPPLPISSPPRLVVDCVYVPALHSAFGPIGEHTTSRPGVFELGADGRRLTIYDARSRPERWEASLQSLYRCIGRMARQGAGHQDRRGGSAGADLPALVGHLRAEYRAFLDRYGQTRRERPPAPAGATEAELRRWTSDIDAHLAREPLWGPYFERMWRGNLEALAALERPVD